MIKFIEDNLPEGVKLVFIARGGSALYNLETQNSDADWLGFCTAPIEMKYAQQLSFGNNDISLHILNRFAIRLLRQDARYTELLYAPTVLFGSNMSERVVEIIKNIWYLRGQITTMNLYDMYIRRYEEYQVHKQDLTNELSLSSKTKRLIHAYRSLDTPLRFMKNGFTDYTDALYYGYTEEIRSVLMGVKTDPFNHDAFLDILKAKEQEYITSINAFINNDITNVQMRVQQLLRMLEEEVYY